MNATKINRRGPRPGTVAKYTAVIEKMRTMDRFDQMKLIKNHHMNANFPLILKEAEYVLPTEKAGIYLVSEKLRKADPETLATWVLNQSAKKQNGSKSRRKEMHQKECMALKEASLEEIAEELKSRGYTGMIEPIKKSIEF